MTYEERLERDLSQIREQIRGLSESIEQALQNAIHALLTADEELAYGTILGDARINRASRELIRTSHRFVARHLPSAGHLRFISTVMRLSDELERIGDYAATICREIVQFQQKPPVTILRDIDLLADQTFVMFRQAVRSFDEGNAEKARGIRTLGDQIGRTVDRVFQDLVSEGSRGSRPIEDLFGLLLIFNRLGRVASRSKNICEATIFYATGQTKSPKQYKILFIDARNDRASQLAEAIGHRAFAEQGSYSSCGWNPAENLHQDFKEFLDVKGLKLGSEKPRALPPFEELGDYDVIVALEKGIKDSVPRIPFHTILQQWDIAAEAPGGARDLPGLFQVLSGKIEELMECLWGHGE